MQSLVIALFALPFFASGLARAERFPPGAGVYTCHLQHPQFGYTSVPMFGFSADDAKLRVTADFLEQNAQGQYVKKSLPTEVVISVECRLGRASGG